MKHKHTFDETSDPHNSIIVSHN